MEWLGELWRRLRMLVRRSQFDADLEDEMRLHVELRAQEQVEAGAPTNEAAYAARRRFGNTVLLREVSRETWGWSIARSVAAGHPLWLADAGEESWRDDGSAIVVGARNRSKHGDL